MLLIIQSQLLYTWLRQMAWLLNIYWEQENSPPTLRGWSAMQPRGVGVFLGCRTVLHPLPTVLVPSQWCFPFSRLTLLLSTTLPLSQVAVDHLIPPHIFCLLTCPFPSFSRVLLLSRPVPGRLSQVSHGLSWQLSMLQPGQAGNNFRDLSLDSGWSLDTWKCITFNQVTTFFYVIS